MNHGHTVDRGRGASLYEKRLDFSLAPLSSEFPKILFLHEVYSIDHFLIVEFRKLFHSLSYLSDLDWTVCDESIGAASDIRKNRNFLIKLQLFTYLDFAYIIFKSSRKYYVAVLAFVSQFFYLQLPSLISLLL